MPTAPSTHTTAQWIWLAGPSEPNMWLRCRRTFQLSALPAEAMARIAVDSKYWLWVNGKLVVREGGLKRGPTPRDTYVDEIDLAPYLVAGENTIAVLAWFWGVDGSSHINSGQGGLMFELAAGDQHVISDRQWRVSRHPCFLPSTIKLFSGKGVLTEWDVYYDARPDKPTWTEPSFDDRTWSIADEKGSPPCQPWGELVPRPIPFWRDSELLAYPSQSTTTDGQVVAKLPANLQVYPYFKITAPAGLKITIAIERDWKTTQYTTREGEQAFEVPAWGNGHHVTYTFPPGVEVLDLRYRETGYDADFAGSFTCDDPAFNTLWTKAARSTYLCMRDTYMDCPDRERAQWPNDAAPMIEQASYALDRRADALGAKLFREFVDWKTPEGILWGTVPTGRFRNTFREFRAISLSAVVGLWEYFWYSGDVATITHAFPIVRDYLLQHYPVDPIEGVAHRGPDQVEWGPGTQNWYDWGDQQDWRLMDNAWLALALDSVGFIGATLGQDTSELAGRSRLIRDSFDRLFWRGDHYASPGRTDPPDERGNALAVRANLASRDKWPALHKLFLGKPQASIYMEKFVIDALIRMGRLSDALARIKHRFADAISSDYTTLPEHFGERSNHGWGGWPLTMLSKYVAGIEPLTPGGARFLVRPNLGPLKRVKAVVPSAAGDIRVSIDRDDRLFVMDLQVPTGADAVVTIRRDIFAEHGREVQHVEINGTPLFAEGAITESMQPMTRLTDKSVQFPLTAGPWRIVATS